MAKCERLPEIEVVIRLENVAPWIMDQPDIYPSDDDAITLAGTLFSLEEARDAAEVQGALVVPSEIVNARERRAAYKREDDLMWKNWARDRALEKAKEERKIEAKKVRKGRLLSDVLRDGFI